MWQFIYPENTPGFRVAQYERCNMKIYHTDAVHEGAFLVCPYILPVAIRQLFEHGSETVSRALKVSCSFFRITMLKKLPDRHVYDDADKRGMLPFTTHFQARGFTS